MKTMTIRWQRLVDSGRTCPRCGDTAQEVRQAAAALTAALAPLGIAVHLEEGVIEPAEFERAPLESNRILIDGRSLEEWLGGDTGQSPCCEVCGPNDCRTVTVDGTSYDVIPADLVIRAGLLAATAHLATPAPPVPCCGVPSAHIPVRPGRATVSDATPAGGDCCG